MLITAVIVTYNRLDLLKECIASFENMSNTPQQIVIVNNASTDGTTEYLSTLETNSNIHIENLPTNIGGAGGFAHGIKTAVQMGCDAVWIMDDDTIPHPTSLAELCNALQQYPQAGFAGSRVLWTNGEEHTMNIPSFKTEEDKASPIRLVNSSSFVSMLILTSVIEQIGLPYKEFFIWGDDVEYSNRIVRQGYEGLYVKASIVTHKTATNYGPEISSAPVGAAWKFYYGQRNCMFMHRSKYPSPFTFYLKELNHLRLALHNIAKRPKTERKAFRKVILQGFKDGCHFQPTIEYINHGK